LINDWIPNCGRYTTQFHSATPFRIDKEAGAPKDVDFQTKHWPAYFTMKALEVKQLSLKWRSICYRAAASLANIHSGEMKFVVEAFDWEAWECRSLLGDLPL